MLPVPYPRDGATLIFTQERISTFRYGDLTSYEGTLTEHTLHGTPKTIHYVYYPAGGILYIDRYVCRSDGLVIMCAEALYRVEKIDNTDNTEYWLYDLENVDNKEGDYRLRLKIGKMEE